MDDLDSGLLPVAATGRQDCPACTGVKAYRIRTRAATPLKFTVPGCPQPESAGAAQRYPRKAVC